MVDSMLNPNAFSELRVSELPENSATDFDLYVLVEGRPVLYAVGPHWWDSAELNRLKATGRMALLFRKSDSGKVRTWQRIQAIHPTLMTGDQAIPAISDAAAELNRILYEQSLSHAVVAKGQVIANEMIRCIKNDPQSVAAIGKLARHDDYTYYHSARVAAYALAIAVTMSETSDEALSQIAMGCLFHDVGKSQIGLSVLNKPQPLTPAEWDLMRRHPGLGLEVIDGGAKTVFSPVARTIVAHHHERIDGGGYPGGLVGKEISTEVRIAAIADIFDALTTPRPYQASKSRYEAFDFIRHHLLAGIDPEVYKALVQLFRGA